MASKRRTTHACVGQLGCPMPSWCLRSLSWPVACFCRKLWGHPRLCPSFRWTCKWLMCLLWRPSLKHARSCCMTLWQNAYHQERSRARTDPPANLTPAGWPDCARRSPWLGLSRSALPCLVSRLSCPTRCSLPFSCPRAWCSSSPDSKWSGLS